MKVALCLEEMGLAYEPIPVDTRKGKQHEASYLAITRTPRCLRSWTAT
jgi:GST-like protein